MDNRREQEVLDLVAKARQKADAFIVVGILADNRIVYSVDPRMSIPDLHGALQDNIDFICESEARRRSREQEQRQRQP